MISGGRERQLIVNADDFGADPAVNEAVEQAHVEGILTAASLMVGAPAAAAAVRLARKLPGLGIGLHLVLVEGRPVLPPSQLPDLVDATGNFRSDMVASAVGMFVRPRARRQLAAEIDAQFAAFAATRPDARSRQRAQALPPPPDDRRRGAAYRPALRHARRARAGRAGRGGASPHPFAKLLRRRLRAAGMLVPDRVHGLADSGRMTSDRLRAIVAALPPGLSEIYLHPATIDDYPGHGPGYAHRAELAALTDPDVRSALASAGIRTGRFADFGDGHAA